MYATLYLVAILSVTIHLSHAVVYSCDRTAVCGCSANSASVNRIVGGEDAIAASWSWTVSISLNNEDLCGGTIISNTWIITAAHCVNNYYPSQIHINVGSSILYGGTNNPSVARIIIHPNFNSDTYDNDIALIQLATPLDMTNPSISQICMPYVSSELLLNREWPPSLTTVVAVGWGRLYEQGPNPWALQQVTLSTVDYRSSTCGPIVNNIRNQFCAGVYGGGKDTCQGDSGGPLMMFTASRQWVLVGITSYGVGCARPTSAGIYTRVAVYENWIRSITGGTYRSIPFSSSSENHSVKKSANILLLSFVIFLLKLY